MNETRLRRLIELGGNLVANLDLDSLLSQILEASRELTGARYAALGVLNEGRNGLAQFITAGIDDRTREEIDGPPHERGVLGKLIEDPEPLRLSDVSLHPEAHGFPPGHPHMTTFVGVPIMIHGRSYGNLYLADKLNSAGAIAEFDDADEASLSVLANWAAIAIDNAHSMQQDRRRVTVAAAERERGRWARELHDETLQSLAGLNMLLSSALRRGGEELLERAAREAVEQITVDISNLRSLIAELRPAALDALGLHEALESLAEHTAATGEVEVEADIVVRPPGTRRLEMDLAVAAYRLVQEALNNAIKHSGASHVWLSAIRADGQLEIDVRDDGRGFDPETTEGGFGIIGMRERVELVGGEFDVLSAPGAGTSIHASLPIIWPDATDSGTANPGATRHRARDDR
ncbi:MAG: GAF domain-containing sensor histidine kinase [Actinobacteria bacterium]|nr:GAF domain-containing sensor histidine kinase [Actinomycetota bacterium]